MSQSGVIRWGGAAAIVLGLHTLAVVLLTNRTVVVPTRFPAPEAIMLDLTPDLPPLQKALAASPAPTAVSPPPAPPASRTPEPPLPPTPEPPLAPELPLPPPQTPPTPPVAAEAVLPPPPRTKPHPRPLERPVERRPPLPKPTAASSVQPVMPSAPIASPGPPQPAARLSAPPSNALPNWRGEVMGRLQRAKRYPDLARSRGLQGVSTVTFTIDRTGRVLDVRLTGSAGSPVLDDEAVALVSRAEPLPAIPDEIGGATVTLTVPISFTLR